MGSALTAMPVGIYNVGNREWTDVPSTSRTVHVVETPCVSGLSTRGIPPDAETIIHIGRMRVNTLPPDSFV